MKKVSEWLASEADSPVHLYPTSAGSDPVRVSLCLQAVYAATDLQRARGRNDRCKRCFLISTGACGPHIPVHTREEVESA